MMPACIDEWRASSEWQESQHAVNGEKWSVFEFRGEPPWDPRTQATDDSRLPLRDADTWREQGGRR